MTVLDSESDDEPADELLDTALPVALLVAAASWLPVSVLLFGYAVRVLRAELRGDDDLPTLADVRSLTRTGLSAAAVVVVYQLPALVVVAAAFVTAASSAGADVVGDPFAPSATTPALFVNHYAMDPNASLVTLVGFVLAGVTLVLTSYAGTVALVTFAAADRFDAAFDVDVLLAGLGSARFRRGFVLASGLGFVGSGAAWLVTLVPVVGPFVGAFAELFFLVGALRVVADGYDERVILRASRDIDIIAAASDSEERSTVT